MKQGAAPFDPRVVLGLLLVGAGALLLFLYAVGAGWDGRSERDGGAHAAANGLNGFAGLAALLERRGHAVSLSRNRGRLGDPALLVLTPPHFADGEALAEVLAERRWQGPTLLILPKWFAIELPEEGFDELPPQGWVQLGNGGSPAWLEELDGLVAIEARIGRTQGWRGLGRTGGLARPDVVQAVSAEGLEPLVSATRGALLAGSLEGADWPLMIVAEPDLLNNYGLADQERAALALALVERALDGEDLPILFDLTLPGLGASDNLLTLTFRPPFLAATLCLMLAAIVVGWRGFRRFGPVVAGVPDGAEADGAMGKRQLARNGAALVERSGRLHLLGPPYAALMARRIGARLGAREHDEAAIARLLALRGFAEDFTARMAALRAARRPRDLISAARALAQLERTIAR